MAYSRGALGGTRTPTMLLTATSRQRVYQFRHERLNLDSRIGPYRGADVTNHRPRDKAAEGDFTAPNQRLPTAFGSICLTSTAIRLRSTSTTPEATGRVLARILTSSASVASSSMMAPRLSRMT